MNWLSRFLGYRDDLESENKYTYIITAFSFSFVALFLIFYITIIKSGIINLLTSICLAAVSLVFLLLKKKMFNFAKTLLLSAYLLQMLGLVFFWFPVEANFNFFYYTLPPISFLIFDIRIKQGQISLITLNTLALLMLVLSETLLLETPLIELSIQNIRFFGSLSALCSITSIIVVFYFYTVNLMKIYRKLDLIASTDDLTGTFNRRTLYKEGELVISLCRRYNRTMSVLVLDIDFFKKVNDEYGHPSGDAVLIQLSKLIKENIRKNDILSRFGGEEFVIIVKESSIRSAVQAANHIRETIEKYDFILPGDKHIKITVSVGAAELSNDHKDFQDIFSAADKALYRAKDAGRNIVIPTVDSLYKGDSLE